MSSSQAEWPAGFQIIERTPGPPQDIVDAFRSIPVAVAGDCMGRCIGAMGLRPYHTDLRATLCGPALTVRIRPGDNLMVHKAIMMAQPGDVIVIDGGGDLTQAVIGGLIRTSALARGIAGFVLNGALRDVAEWAEGGIFAFARGHTHRGPSKEGPGEINVPVSCAGLVVNPGDLVLGDADGVIAIPAADAAALLPLAKAHLSKEETIRESNRLQNADPERFLALLRAKGCPV